MKPTVEIQLLENGKIVQQQTYTTPQTISVGRGTCDFLCENSAHISRVHCYIEWLGNIVTITDKSSNGCFLKNGQSLVKGLPHILEHGEEISLADGHYKLRFALSHFSNADSEKTDVAPNESTTTPSIPPKQKPSNPAHEFTQIENQKNRPSAAPPGQNVTSSNANDTPLEKLPTSFSISNSIFVKDSVEGSKDNLLIDLLNKKTIVTIGRDLMNDIVLNSLIVSRFHAEVHKLSETEFKVVDKNSANGTFIEGVPIKGQAILHKNQTFTISNFEFSLKQGAVIDSHESQLIAIEAKSVVKRFGEKTVLHPHSFVVKKGEFIAMMGPSGCGKSTLLEYLNGASPASSGLVKILGKELNSRNFPTIQQSIDYVPQKDIVHGDLNIKQTLYFAAKLRLPKDITDAEISKRSEELLSQLNLDFKDEKLMTTPRKTPFGGQRKRVAIAVEMLNKPAILFLDEPTSPLDPETIQEFLKSLQNLNEKEGTTILMVTHKPSDLDFSNRVLFMSKGGYLSYYGPSDKIYSYFSKSEIIEVYNLLGNPVNGIENGKHYYTLLQNTSSGLNEAAIEYPKIEKPKESNLFRQWFWLSKRYLQSKLNNRNALFFLAIQPVVIALLMVFVFDKLQAAVLFMMAVSAIWFGVNNAAREIVDENAIYKRERMYNVNILTYIFSKIGVLALFSFVQVVVFVGILYLKFSDPINSAEKVELHSFFPNILLMLFLSTSATLIGLWLSAYFNTAEEVLFWVPIVLIPQIMLSGMLTRLDSPVKEGLSFFTLGRWGTEAFAHIQDSSALEKKVYRIESGFLSDCCTTKSDSSLASVHYEAPYFFRRDSLELKTQTAGKALNLYSRKNAFKWFNHKWRNILAMFVLNTLVFAGIYYSLRKKDPI